MATASEGARGVRAAGAVAAARPKQRRGRPSLRFAPGTGQPRWRQAARRHAPHPPSRVLQPPLSEKRASPTWPPAPAAAETADRFTFSYGAGDELLERLRESTGEVDRFTHGSYGRIQARDSEAFAYDPVGRCLEDDRFRYRWDWRGQLVEVEVKATWPDSPGGDGEADVSPYAGHRVAYHYDARGRLLRRLHEGADDGSGARPFIEERRYVWEEDRLAAEAAYGPSETGVNLRWRKTYVPGPIGLDDPPQVVVEILQPGSRRLPRRVINCLGEAIPYPCASRPPDLGGRLCELRERLDAPGRESGSFWFWPPRRSGDG